MSALVLFPLLITQEFIMATKSKSKTQAQDVPFNETLQGNAGMGQPVHATVDDSGFDFREFCAMYGIVIPGWKRALVSFVASIAVGCLVASAASTLIDILVVGAMSVTGSLFLAWTLYVVAFIAAAYVACKAGAKVARWILSGAVDEQASAAKNKVTGWFKSREKPIVAA